MMPADRRAHAVGAVAVLFGRIGRALGIYPHGRAELLDSFNRTDDDWGVPLWVVGQVAYGRSGGMMYHSNTFDRGDER